MPEPPRTGDAVLELVRKSELVDDDVLNSFVTESGTALTETPAADIASQLVKAGVLTPFQAKAFLQGKSRGFRLGPYRILDQIGAGGMGQVFLAEHSHMKRLVAVKVLPPRLALDKGMIERFYREARAVAALDHPNIVRAHDVACYKGTHYLVLEYIEGRSLAERLISNEGPLSIGEACGYIVQAAAGLKHAHDKGIAHRDIKPGNLLVDKEGVVKILDMGLARFFEDDRDRITRDLDGGSVMGTADYVAPEQLMDSATADHRADIYSLGATFYHLVTGRPPFEGSTTAKLVAHQLKAVPPAHSIREDVPEEVSEIIEQMMEKDPDDRYQSATDLIAELLPFVGNAVENTGMQSGRLPPVVAASVSQSGMYVAMTSPLALPPTKRPNRKKQLALLTLIAVTLIGTGLIAAFVLQDDANPGVVDTSTPPEPDDATKTHALNPKGSDLPDQLTRAFKLDVAKTNVEVGLFTPDDKLLITAGNDKLVRVWDGANGRAIRKLEGHTDNIRAISLLPDGRRLLSGSLDKSLKLWDLASGNCLRTYHGNAQFVGVVALPDGRRFLSSATDGSIWLWDIETEEVLKKYDPAPLPVYGLAVSRDGRRGVAGTWDAKRNSAKPEELAKLPPVSVWTFEVETGKELKRVATDTSVSHIRMSHDGRFAVFGTNTGVTVWDIDTGSFRAFRGVLKRTIGATFTRDGRHILSTGYDNTLTLWDVTHGKPIAGEAGMPGQGFNAATSHNEKRAIVVGANGVADVWRLPAVVVPAPRDPDLPHPIALLANPVGTPEDLIFTPDGTRIVGAAQSAKHLMVWDAATGLEVTRWKLPDNSTGARALALLPGDRLVSCGVSDPIVRVWNLKTGELLRQLSADKVSGYTSVATTLDGRVLATANDKTVRLWNAAADKDSVRFDLKADVRGLAVTSDGTRFVVGCGDKSVRLWDIATKTEVRKLQTEPIVWRVGISPDSKWIGYGTSSGIILWNLETAEIRFLPGAEKYIDGVAFTKDGRVVLGGSADRGLYAWEFGTGKSLGKVTEHTNNIRSVVLSPAGNRIATSSTDNTGIIWQLPDSLGK
ncbi:MAG: serine/threonine protein kinase [Planctomycetes bacterium]|nr:serine/threonine protein kinase [Planctomycetota bacterium]